MGPKAHQRFKKMWTTSSGAAPEIDADCVWDSSRLLISGSVKKELLNLEKTGRVPSLNQLRKAVSWPELTRFGSELRHHIEIKGYLLVRNFPFNALNAHTRRMMFLFLVDSCGAPVSHIPGKEEYIWEITPRDVQRPFPTYSEHNLEATLHTDSNYREKPEEFVAFLVEKAAGCGGGKVILLRIAPVLTKLEETEEGRRCLNILRSQRFPSMVPSAYSESSAYVEAPIITGGTVRFRPDTLEAGMKVAPSFETPERVWALHFFSQLLDQSPDRLTLALAQGEMLFINNHTVLHGRTAFEDRSRLLLRVRFHSPNPVVGRI